MVSPFDRHRFALGALVALAALAGFLLATSVSGAEYATVGTVEGEHQAYAVPVGEEGDRLRFRLDASNGASGAQISIFDPQDDFVASFDLTPERDRVDVVTERPGRWVVFVHEAHGGPLLVQSDQGPDAGGTELTELPVDRDHRTLLEQDGGGPHRHVVFQVERRPAAVDVDWRGNVTGLDVRVESQRGQVYRVEDGQARGSDPSAQQRQRSPGNLTEGSYEATIEAENLDGEVTFVRYDYIRNPVDLANATKKEKIDAARNGTTVARMEDGQAYEIDTVGASEMLFWTQPSAHAHVRVYTTEDRFVDELALGQHAGTCSSGCQDDVEEESPRIAQFVEVEEPGTYVAYVSYVDAPGTNVSVAVPEVDQAPAATQLFVEQTEVSFVTQLGQTHAEDNRTLPGALLEARIDTEATAASQRNVTVEGPLGIALRYEEAARSLDAAAYSTRQEHVDRYTSGEFTVQVDNDWTAEGSTTVTLTYYER